MTLNDFRTHKLGGEPAPPGFDPIAYWKTQPDLMYNLDEEVVAFKDLERNIKCVGFAGENRKGWEREETIAA